jgi:hypothetical protein
MSDQVREVVAAFDGVEMLENAVADLEARGFDRAAFSLLASERAVEQKLGQRYRRVEEMEDNPKAPRETFLSWASRLDAGYGLAPALAFVGAVAVGIGLQTAMLPILIAAGSGATIGAALSQLIHHHYAELLSEQIQRGGLLLWVNVRNREEELKAITVLKAHHAHHVHAHSLTMRPPTDGRAA